MTRPTELLAATDALLGQVDRDLAQARLARAVDRLIESACPPHCANGDELVHERVDLITRPLPHYDDHYARLMAALSDLKAGYSYWEVEDEWERRRAERAQQRSRTPSVPSTGETATALGFRTASESFESSFRQLMVFSGGLWRPAYVRLRGFLTGIDAN